MSINICTANVNDENEPRCNQTDSTVILLPAHPAFFAHNFVSGIQSFYFSESQDAIAVIQFGVGHRT